LIPLGISSKVGFSGPVVVWGSARCSTAAAAASVGRIHMLVNSTRVGKLTMFEDLAFWVRFLDLEAVRSIMHGLRLVTPSERSWKHSTITQHICGLIKCGNSVDRNGRCSNKQTTRQFGHYASPRLRPAEARMSSGASFTCVEPSRNERIAIKGIIYVHRGDADDPRHDVGAN
jgi:hypothetical protein